MSSTIQRNHDVDLTVLLVTQIVFVHLHRSTFSEGFSSLKRVTDTP